MIKPSAILLLLALFFVLMTGYLLIPASRPQVLAPAANGEKLIKEFNFDSVKVIEIKKGDAQVKIEKKDGNWVLPMQKNRPARKDRIETQLIKDLKDAKLEDTRPGKDSLFGLDDAERTELTMFNETGKTTVYLGNSPATNKVFARPQPAGPVLEIDKGLDTLAGVRVDGTKRILDPAYFYDLKVLSYNNDDLIDIVIKKGHDVTRIQKVVPGKGPVEPKKEIAKDDKPVWWITEPDSGEADENSIKTIVSNFAALNVKSYADDVAEKDRGLDAPTAKVKLRLKDGTEHDLIFGKIGAEDVIVSIAGRQDVFKVYKYVYDTLTRDFKKKDEEKKESGEPGNLLPPPALPPGHPTFPPNAPKTDAPKIDLPLKKTEAVPPPPPPLKVEPSKPAQPPAVVKDPKADEKK